MTNVDAMTDRADRIATDWASSPRWKRARRDYSAEDVVRLQGSFVEEHTLASAMAERLWELITGRDYVNSLGPKCFGFGSDRERGRGLNEGYTVREHRPAREAAREAAIRDRKRASPVYCPNDYWRYP